MPKMSASDGSTNHGPSARSPRGRETLLHAGASTRCIETARPLDAIESLLALYQLGRLSRRPIKGLLGTLLAGDGLEQRRLHDLGKFVVPDDPRPQDDVLALRQNRGQIRVGLDQLRIGVEA